ncbi:MAG: hypothetical protein GY816_15185 [Cytophagales bacterium]|nr:hypothetical protein [Cytophagales bacterium]
MRRKFKVNSPRVKEEARRESLDGLLYRQKFDLNNLLAKLGVLLANLTMT